MSEATDYCMKEIERLKEIIDDLQRRLEELENRVYYIEEVNDI